MNAREEFIWRADWHVIEISDDVILFNAEEIRRAIFFNVIDAQAESLCRRIIYSRHPITLESKFAFAFRPSVVFPIQPIDFVT